MKVLAGLTVVCVTIASALLPAMAQHTLAAKFDPTKPLTLRGTVTQIDWANPYAHVLMKVPTAGKLVLWAVEIESPILLAKNGWTDATLNPGDQITVEGFRARNGTNQLSGNSITLASSGKKVLTGYNGTPPARTT